MHLQKTALVLEGGGMRGMFSAGVFEAFLAHQLTFPSPPRRFCRSLQYLIIYVCPTAAHTSDYRALRHRQALLQCAQLD